MITKLLGRHSPTHPPTHPHSQVRAYGLTHLAELSDGKLDLGPVDVPAAVDVKHREDDLRTHRRDRAGSERSALDQLGRFGAPFLNRCGGTWAEASGSQETNIQHEAAMTCMASS